ncbi:MAG: DNA/RNA nuclease SfsA [Oscillospiraceae bacterium]|nr:DNA/RNA nuclease SfsA [Oscillospiraceae bacterium]
MRYKNVVQGRFLERKNRFIAIVEIGGEVQTVHVKNTGRCRELLVPNCPVWCVHAAAEGRKTAYDLITAEKNGRLINLDAQAPNKLFHEWAAEGNYLPLPLAIRPEFTHEDSRFDFRLEREGRIRLVEVKGVTLEQDGHVSFPDAPTERGVKHLRGLMRAAESGMEAAVVFVIQMEGAKDFSPADQIHPEFGKVLREAAERGVQVQAFDCTVTPEVVRIRGTVPVLL